MFKWYYPSAREDETEIGHTQWKFGDEFSCYPYDSGYCLLPKIYYVLPTQEIHFNNMTNTLLLFFYCLSSVYN